MEAVAHLARGRGHGLCVRDVAVKGGKVAPQLIVQLRRVAGSAHAAEDVEAASGKFPRRRVADTGRGTRDDYRGAGMLRRNAVGCHELSLKRRKRGRRTLGTLAGRCRLSLPSLAGRRARSLSRGGQRATRHWTATKLVGRLVSERSAFFTAARGWSGVGQKGGKHGPIARAWLCLGGTASVLAGGAQGLRRRTLRRGRSAHRSGRPVCQRGGGARFRACA